MSKEDLYQQLNQAFDQRDRLCDVICIDLRNLDLTTPKLRDLFLNLFATRDRPTRERNLGKRGVILRAFVRDDATDSTSANDQHLAHGPWCDFDVPGLQAKSRDFRPSMCLPASP